MLQSNTTLGDDMNGAQEIDLYGSPPIGEIKGIDGSDGANDSSGMDYSLNSTVARLDFVEDPPDIVTVCDVRHDAGDLFLESDGSELVHRGTYIGCSSRTKQDIGPGFKTMSHTSETDAHAAACYENILTVELHDILRPSLAFAGLSL